MYSEYILPTLALLGLASAKTYDYIVVGGGTSGLVVANRLSELKNLNILIIEAGDTVQKNPNVTSPWSYTKAFGTDIDWDYGTVPQVHANNAPQVIHAGKAVGGTTTINGKKYNFGNVPLKLMMQQEWPIPAPKTSKSTPGKQSATLDGTGRIYFPIT
jgi:hypothetical protein